MYIVILYVSQKQVMITIFAHLAAYGESWDSNSTYSYPDNVSAEILVIWLILHWNCHMYKTNKCCTQIRQTVLVKNFKDMQKPLSLNDLSLVSQYFTH